MNEYTILNENELHEFNGGAVVIASGLVALLGGVFTAGYTFGSDLARGERHRQKNKKEIIYEL